MCRWRRRPQFLLSSLLQRPLLGPFPPGQDGRSSAVVDVGGGDVVARLVQLSVIVVLNEARERALQFPWACSTARASRCSSATGDTPEPGLSVCSALHERGLAPSTYGLKTNQPAWQVANTLRELGVISAPGPKVDPIAEILHARYGVPRGKSWHQLLAAEYVHALGLLKQAEDADRHRLDVRRSKDRRRLQIHA